jgi:hypothetical protein
MRILIQVNNWYPKFNFGEGSSLRSTVVPKDAENAIECISMPYFWSMNVEEIENRSSPGQVCCRNYDIKLTNSAFRHLPSTLDEFSQPALNEDLLKSQNEDQVLFRYALRSLAKELSLSDDEFAEMIDERSELDNLDLRIRETSLLTVPTLWICKFDKMCITAFPFQGRLGSSDYWAPFQKQLLNLENYFKERKTVPVLSSPHSGSSIQNISTQDLSISLCLAQFIEFF